MRKDRFGLERPNNGLETSNFADKNLNRNSKLFLSLGGDLGPRN